MDKRPPCKQVSKEAWDNEVRGLRQFQFTKEIKSTKRSLKTWNRMTLKNCDKEIQKMLEDIDAIQKAKPTVESRQLEVEMQIKLQELFKRKELIRRKKPRKLWLKDEDENIRFFHLSTIIKKE